MRRTQWLCVSERKTDPSGPTATPTCCHCGGGGDGNISRQATVDRNDRLQTNSLKPVCSVRNENRFFAAEGQTTFLWSPSLVATATDPESSTVLCGPLQSSAPSSVILYSLLRSPLQSSVVLCSPLWPLRIPKLVLFESRVHCTVWIVLQVGIRLFFGYGLGTINRFFFKRFMGLEMKMMKI